jgi:ABC-type cobalamin/Fe3+-siderophores transport system ATPase subunit
MMAIPNNIAPAGALVYLVGAPGAGKSTLMAALTSRCDRATADGRIPYDVLKIHGQAVGVEMGRRRPGGFSGTDAMSMSVQRGAEQWISARPARLILGEGMRLGNMKFFQAAKNAGYDVHIVHVNPGDGIAQQQRAERGSSQNAQWVASATTRARNVADSVMKDPEMRLWLPAHDKPEKIVLSLIKAMPFLEGLGAR